MKIIILSILLFVTNLVSTLKAQEIGDILLVTAKNADIKVDSTVLKTVNEGNEIIYKDTSESWYWVEKNGTIGWIKDSSVKTPDQAISHYSKILETNPTSTNYVFRGNAYLHNKEYDSAMADANEAIRLSPKSSRPYELRSEIYARMKLAEKAFSDSDKAIELNPKSSILYNNRGVLWANLGNVKEAIKDYTKSIEINAKSAVVYANRAVAYYKTNEFDLGIQDASLAVKLAPAYSSAYITRAKCYVEKEKFDLAIKDLNIALENDPENSKIHQRRAIYYRKIGEYAQALNDHNQAINHDPKNVFLYQSRAWFRVVVPDEKFYDLQKAKSDFEISKSLSPQKFWSHHELNAVILAAEGSFQLAVKECEKSIQMQKELNRSQSQLSESEERLLLYQDKKTYKEIPQKRRKLPENEIDALIRDLES